MYLKFKFKQKFCEEKHQYTALLFSFFSSRYELDCTYRIISQISIYNWMQNCIFRYFWYCIFIFQRSKYISNCSRKSTLNSQQCLKDFKSFSLFYNFYLIIFISFFIISFQTLIHKETSRLQSLSHVAYFEFFL